MRSSRLTARAMRRIATLTTASAVMLIAGTGVAHAHMGIELRGSTPTAGSSSTLMFRPGHGCDGDATNALTVTIPDGIPVASVKAQPKAGWKLTRNGNQITWSSGELADNEFDEFGLRVSWPKFDAGVTSQTYYFKSVQNCNAEIKVNRSGAQATVTGFLPRVAGQKVALFVDDVPLTKNGVMVGADGKFSVPTTSAKVPAGAKVEARIGDRMVGDSVGGVEAWVEIPAAGSTASLASPAPSVKVVAGTTSGH